MNHFLSVLLKDFLVVSYEIVNGCAANLHSTSSHEAEVAGVSAPAKKEGRPLHWDRPSHSAGTGYHWMRIRIGV